jgi:RNA polymerase sigma factor (TIGR02999 family)
MRPGHSPHRAADAPPGASGDDLLPVVYARLRAIAARCMQGERSDHTLGATGLVHEAYLRLAGSREKAWANEAHFFVAAAEAMRRVLVDHARGRATLKRGQGRISHLGPGEDGLHALASLSDAAEAATPEQILALDEALSRLQAEDPRSAAVVRLRFFAGLSVEHTAQVLASSPRTVAREWVFARTRLFELLTAAGVSEAGP